MTSPLENIISRIRGASIGNVYAGPSPEDVTQNEEPTMDETTTPDLSAFEAVYAGPTPIDDADMRLIYAAPSQMVPSEAVGFFDEAANSFGGFGIGMSAGNAYPQSFADDGPSMPTSKRFCPECGSPAKENAAFCSSCGAPLPKEKPPTEPAEVDFIDVYNGPDMM